MLSWCGVHFKRTPITPLQCGLTLLLLYYQCLENMLKPVLLERGIQEIRSPFLVPITLIFLIQLLFLLLIFLSKPRLSTELPIYVSVLLSTAWSVSTYSVYRLAPVPLHSGGSPALQPGPPPDTLT